MKRPTTRRLSAALWLLFAAPALSAAAAPAPAKGPAAPVAVVTDLAGTADAQPKGAAKKALALLDELAAGTKLELAAGGRAVVVFVESGEEVELRGPASGEVTAAGVAVMKGAPPAKRSVFSAGKDLRIRPRGSAQASVLLRMTKPEVVLLSPVGTRILERQPTFTWVPVADLESGRIVVLDDDLRTVAEAAVDGSRFTLPADVALEPGRAYTWEIEAKAKRGLRLSGWAAFGVASEAERAQIDAVRPKPDAPFGERVAFALLLDSLELRDEARPVWKALSAERPGDAAIAAKLAE